MIEGEPWFMASDICRILDIYIIRSRNEPNVVIACRKLDADERTLYRIQGMKGRTSVFVSESGLYKLIMRSDKPEAKVFQNWVTKEVLPSIRKTGGYLLNEEARTTAHADTKEAMPLPEGFAQMFQMLFAPVIEPLREEIRQQGAIILSMQDHIEKMANGQSPRDVWFAKTGPVFVDTMSDEHLSRAISSARKYKFNHDVLLTERQKRKVGRTVAA